MAWVRKLDTFTIPKGAQAAGVSTLAPELGISMKLSMSEALAPSGTIGGRNAEARVTFDRAIALANTTAEAEHIRQHLDRLEKDATTAVSHRDTARES